MKILARLFIFVLVTAALLWLGARPALTPVKRETADHPVYTIGDQNYQLALAEGRQVLKFGRMFWGLYPGGLAFSSPSEAQAFLKTRAAQELADQSTDPSTEQWAVYRLSGDYQLDTYLGNGKPDNGQHYLARSMLVIEIARDN